jgi:hypothetical protein
VFSIQIYYSTTNFNQIHVLFGRTVNQTSTGDGLGKMYNSFLSHTSITSKKKTHLARRTLPGVLEEMGHVNFDWSRQGRDTNTLETEFLLTRWMLPAIGKGIHGEKSMVLRFLKQYVCLIHCGINLR